MNRWNSVIYSGRSSTLPPERWGHKLLQVGQYLLLFGGYGGLADGQGKYLQDIWKFDLLKNAWSPLQTTGSVPSARSNYTIHFNGKKEEVILFGGGSDSKARYNTIHILNLKTLAWREIRPRIGQEAPWERTYHTSELCENYLIVFGGEGISNLDLDDLWAFDLIQEKWTRLNPRGICPTRRRFASSALVGTDFYLVGGCQDNYHLLSDMHRLPLLPLLRGDLNDLQWECLEASNMLLKRWGHSTNSYQNKLYIFSGRMSQDKDNSDLIQYDCLRKWLRKVQFKGKIPEPRRRHATVMIGSSLLVFGGYNARYFNDFFYTTLQDTPSHTSDSCRVIIKGKTKEEFIQEISLAQLALRSGDYVSVQQGGVVQKFRTQLSKLKENSYFRTSLKYSNTIQLPALCSFQTFRIINLALTESKIYLRNQISLKECFQIASVLEYFCMGQYLRELQLYLHSQLSEQNALEMLLSASECSLKDLEEAAAITYLRSTHTETSSHSELSILSSPASMQQHSLLHMLSKVYQQNRFDLNQRKLSTQEKGLLSRAVQAIKSIFWKQPQNTAQVKGVSKGRGRNCLFVLLECLGQMNRMFVWSGTANF